MERSKMSKTGAEWKLEEDHCLSQAVKKYPVFLESRDERAGRLPQPLGEDRGVRDGVQPLQHGAYGRAVSCAHRGDHEEEHGAEHEGGLGVVWVCEAKTMETRSRDSDGGRRSSRRRTRWRLSWTRVMM